MATKRLGASAHVFGAVFVGIAVAALVRDGPSLSQVVLPVGIAVAFAGTVLLIASRTTRFRFQLLILGWLVSAFTAAALVEAGGVEPVVTALLYPPLIIWGSAFFDIRSETFRSDQRYQRGGSGADH